MNSVFAIPQANPSSPLRGDIILASPGGAALLLANGCAWLAAGLAACFLHAETAAVAYLLLPLPALLLALVLRPRLHIPRLPRASSLAVLIAQFVILPLVAMPALLDAQQFEPDWVVAILALLLGAQLLPYCWVQRSWFYTALAAACALAPSLLAATLGESALPWIGAVVGGCLLVAVPAVMSQARFTLSGRGWKA